MIDDWARDFLRRLVRKYGPHRAPRYGEPASLESQIDWPSEDTVDTAYWRLHSEDRFLSRTAHDIRALLLRTMASAASASDKDDAALLYRRGVERGWWDRLPAKVEQVRVAASTAPAFMAESTVPARHNRVPMASNKPASTKDPEFQNIFAAVRACNALRGVMDDPKANTGARLYAIRQFFDAMEDAGRGDLLKEVANDAQG